MSDEETDVFNAIIKHNNLDGILTEAEVTNLNMAQLHEGVSTMSESMMYLMDFITQFFTAEAEGRTRPGMSKSMIVNIKQMFESAEAFNEEIAETQDDDEEDDL